MRKVVRELKHLHFATPRKLGPELASLEWSNLKKKYDVHRSNCNVHRRRVYIIWHMATLTDPRLVDPPTLKLESLNPTSEP